MQAIEVFRPDSKRKIETVFGLMMTSTYLIGGKLAISVMLVDSEEILATVEVDPEVEHYVVLELIDEKLTECKFSEED